MSDSRYTLGDFSPALQELDDLLEDFDSTAVDRSPSPSSSSNTTPLTVPSAVRRSLAAEINAAAPPSTMSLPTPAEKKAKADAEELLAQLLNTEAGASLLSNATGGAFTFV